MAVSMPYSAPSYTLAHMMPTGGQEDRVLVFLQQVDRLAVGVGAVVDRPEPVAHRELDRLRGLRVAVQPDTGLAGLLACRPRLLGAVLGHHRAALDEYVVVAHQQLDRV